MTNKDRSKKEIILIDCITATISALAIEVIYPPFLPVAILLKLSSFLGVGFVVWTFSKYEAIPILKYKTKTDFSTIYHFTLPAGLSLTDFNDREEAIQNYIGKDIRIDYTYKEIIIEEYDEKMKSFYEYNPTEVKGYVPIVIGYNRKSELVTCDLGKGEPHMLIAGQTGGGKSTTIRCILVTLILYSNVKLHLIDLKNGVEFGLFSKSSKVVSFARNMSQAKRVLEKIDAEIDERYDLFFKNDVRDIVEYNKKFPKNKLDYQLLVVDEFVDLKSDNDAMTHLDTIGRKARACGIHMILSTQHPSAKTITGELKSNIPTILGLKTSNSSDSRVIIDENGLEKLRGNGHGLFKRNGKTEEIQVPFISPEQAEELIKHTNIEKSANGNVKNTTNRYENIKEESLEENSILNADNKFFNRKDGKMDSKNSGIKNDTRKFDSNENYVKSDIPIEKETIIDTTCEEVDFDANDIPIFSCEVKVPKNKVDTDNVDKKGKSNKTMACSSSDKTSTVTCICKCEKFTYDKKDSESCNSKQLIPVRKNNTCVVKEVNGHEKINHKIKQSTPLSIKENDIVVKYTPYL